MSPVAMNLNDLVLLPESGTHVIAARYMHNGEYATPMRGGKCSLADDIRSRSRLVVNYLQYECKQGRGQPYYYSYLAQTHHTINSGSDQWGGREIAVCSSIYFT